METSEAVQATLDGGSREWLLAYDPADNTLRLEDDEQVLAILLDADTGLRAITATTLPASVFIPSVDLDLGWTITFVPFSGNLLLHNPFGDPVGGLRTAWGLVAELREALSRRS